MKSQKKSAVAKISRRDWLEMGLQTLAESGIEAVRVETLAKRLNVTRGSFYWHFKDREDWFDAILNEWQINKTQTIIEKVEVFAEDAPAAKLAKLFEIVAKDDDRLERAVRNWASQDAKVAAALLEIDQQRITCAQDLLQRLGFSEPEANLRARIAYAVKLSWTSLLQPKSLQERLEEMQFIHALLTEGKTVAAIQRHFAEATAEARKPGAESA